MSDESLLPHASAPPPLTGASATCWARPSRSPALLAQGLVPSAVSLRTLPLRTRPLHARPRERLGACGVR